MVKLSAEDRLKCYEFALEVYTEGVFKFFGAFGYIEYKDLKYPPYLCILLNEIAPEIIRSCPYYPSFLTASVFPELVDAFPEKYHNGVIGIVWPKTAEGLLARKEALKTCIEICKTKIK